MNLALYYHYRSHTNILLILQFKLGHTVEVLKSFVESEYGIPMSEQSMYIEEKPMMNPLSLLDYPGTVDRDTPADIIAHSNIC